MILTDTHVLMWAAQSPARLTDEARRLIEAAGEERRFSVVNIWEIAIKRGRRPDFTLDPKMFRIRLFENGWRELAVSGEHVLAVDRLPAIHKDPFDRMMVAQAQVERLVLLTADAAVARYPGQIVRADG